MKVRNRKIILDLIPNLLSPDVESVKVALSILLELSCIKNLSKYFTISTATMWPGFSSGCPKHLSKCLHRSYDEQKIRLKDFIQSVICMPTTTEYEQDQFFENVLRVCYSIDKLFDPYHNHQNKRIVFKELDRKFDDPEVKIEFNNPNENDTSQEKRYKSLNRKYRRFHHEQLRAKMSQWDQLGDLTQTKRTRKLKNKRYLIDEITLDLHEIWNKSVNYSIVNPF